VIKVTNVTEVYHNSQSAPPGLKSGVHGVQTELVFCAERSIEGSALPLKPFKVRTVPDDMPVGLWAIKPSVEVY
jgi:hypothetical protein